MMPNSMPSFFANPFMTPFMPQQAAVVATSLGGSNRATESSQLTGPENGDYRSNPLQTGNYLMQNLQCQEMMQHYIQSLMVAASHLPGSNMSSDGTTTTTTTTTTATSNKLLDDNQEQSSVDSGRFQIDFSNALPVLIQSMQQQLYLNNSTVSQYANSVPVSGTNLAISNVEKKMDNEEKVNESKNCPIKNDESNGIRYHLQQINGHNVELSEKQDDIINEDEISQENENNLSTDIVKCSNIKNDESLVKEENSEIIIKAEGSETVPSKTSISSSSLSKNIPESSSSSTSSTSSSSSSSNGGNNGTSIVQEECRTSVLIKKQMNEIDKEINRRIQNRNIKKVRI
ncbi:hypothetical protein WUBG_04361 [Wuchereria bancrofti]|uniref:Uncharacterized protein n=1 Tax=Wuchereria bancrofti TaxID=6293 RepID=J9ERA4_WUCBA|nr:hypothetical protein WUBG_04361 [Wuchereria bancrofti]VDM11169.1 unnamed protein product [Wuchereria bancrofti]